MFFHFGPIQFVPFVAFLKCFPRHNIVAGCLPDLMKIFPCHLTLSNMNRNFNFGNFVLTIAKVHFSMSHQ